MEYKLNNFNIYIIHFLILNVFIWLKIINMTI